MPEVHPPLEEVTLTAELPHDVAEQARAAQEDQPELLRCILTFGFSQKVIYETLIENSWGL